MLSAEGWLVTFHRSDPADLLVSFHFQFQKSQTYCLLQCERTSDFKSCMVQVRILSRHSSFYVPSLNHVHLLSALLCRAIMANARLYCS